MRVILAALALSNLNTFGACSFSSLGDKSVAMTSTTLGCFESSALSHAPPAPISRIRPRNSKPQFSDRNGMYLGKSPLTQRSHSSSRPNSSARLVPVSRKARVDSRSQRARYALFSVYLDSAMFIATHTSYGANLPGATTFCQATTSFQETPFLACVPPPLLLLSADVFA